MSAPNGPNPAPIADPANAESWFRTMSDSTPVMLWMSDAQRRCVYLNKRWLDFRGRSLEHEVATSGVDGVHPDDVAHALQTFNHAFDARLPFEHEFRLRRNDGVYRWVLDRGEPRFNPDGSFAGYVGACADNHDRKEAQQRQMSVIALAAGLSSANDTRDAARLVNDAIESMCGVNRSAVLLFDENSICRFVGWRGITRSYRDAVTGHCPWKHGELGARSIVIADVRTDPLLAPYIPLFATESIRSLAFIPISTERGVVGKLMLYSDAVGAIGEHEVDAAGLAASCLGVAVGRLQAQERLTHSELRLRTLIDASLDAVVFLDARGNVTSWNRQAERTFGWPAHDALQRPLEELILPPAIRESRKNPLTRLFNLPLASCVSQRLEFAAIDRAGKPLITELALTPVIAGGVLWYSAFLRDITARKRSDERLLAAAHAVSEACGTDEFRNLTRKMAEVLDADVALISELQAPSNRTAITRAVCVDKQIAEPVTYELDGTPCDIVIETMGSCTYSDNVQSLFPDAAPLRWLKSVAYIGCPLVDSTGAPIGIAAVHFRRPIQDSQALASLLRIFATRAASEIERERAAARMREEDERLRLTVDGAAIGTWEWNLETDRLTVNDRWHTILNHDTCNTAVDAASWRDDIYPGDRAAFDAAIRDHLEGRAPSLRVEHRVCRTDRSTAWLLETGRITHRAADGRPIRMAGIRMDISTAKDAEAALVQARRSAEDASRSKSEFLANMSHELRTPLTAILGYADLLADDADGPSGSKARREHLQTIKRNGEHLLAVINDILDLSKIEAGKMRVEEIPTSPSQILSDVISLMQVKAKAKSLQLSVQFATPIPQWIISDPIRLRQILMNLVGNAIKFTEVGSVTIRVSLDSSDAADALIKFEIIDTGIGLTAEQLQNLFSAFSQADASTSRKFGGSGLGLLISRRLANVLGGTISVTSRHQVGSTFTCTIRTGDTEGIRLVNSLEYSVHSECASRDEPSPSLAPLAGCRVLLAEDGIDNQRLIAFYLRAAGATVTVVDNGKLAVEHLCGGSIDNSPTDPAPVDIVLTDIQMPEMDGYAAVRLLRSKGFDLPVIALTAHAMSGDMEKCISAGCDGYATKPIDRQALLNLCQFARSGELRKSRKAA